MYSYIDMMLPILFISFVLISLGAYGIMNSHGIGYFIRIIIASVIFSVIICFIINIVVLDHKKNMCVISIIEHKND